MLVGEKSAKEGEKQHSIPAYDVHNILERKKREHVKSLCNVCYVSPGSETTRAIPLHQTQPECPSLMAATSRHGFMPQMFAFSFGRPQSHQIPPNYLQQLKTQLLLRGDQAFQMLLCTILQVYAHRIMMWFSLEGAFEGLLSNPLLKTCQLAQGLAQVIWEYLLGW